MFKYIIDSISFDIMNLYKKKKKKFALKSEVKVLETILCENVLSINVEDNYKQKKMNLLFRKVPHENSRYGWAAQPSLVINNYNLTSCWLVEFYGISTFVGNLMPNPFLHK